MAKLTISDASRVAGVARSTLHRAIKNGRLSVDPDGHVGPTGGTLRHDAIASISFSNRRLGVLEDYGVSVRPYTSIAHFPEPRHYVLSLRTKNRV